MKIKMLKTKKGSPDGITVNTYFEGQDYDMPNSLADVFINQLEVAKEIGIVIREILKDNESLNDVLDRQWDLEIPEEADEIETPEKPLAMETPMKTIKKLGRPKGSKNKRKKK